MERIWTSPLLQIVPHGDIKKVAPHISRARAYAGYLLDTLSPIRTTRSQRWDEPDGTVIWVQVWSDLLGQRGVTHIYPPGTDEELPTWFFESGLLYWNPLANFYPLRVNLGDELKKFDGFPPYNGTYYESSFWTGTRPDIQYPDYLSNFYTDLRYWPSMWSGLARLAMQGLHAIARNPGEIFGVELQPNQCGIVRDSGFHYWRVRIDSSGVWAAKLALPVDPGDNGPYSPVAALGKLRNEDYDLSNQYERAMLEARVLSAMTVGDEVQIGSSGQIAPIMAEGVAVAYGWKWARGALKAALVPFREECMPEFTETCIGQFVTSLWELEFICEKVDGQWELTGTTVTQNYAPTRTRPRTAVTSIYKPRYGMLPWAYSGVVPGWGENPFPACCYDQFEGNIAPYYCYYDAGDNLQVVWYVQYFSTATSFDDRPSSYVTGSVSFERSGSHSETGWGEVGGGFSVGIDPPLYSDFIDMTGVRYDETYTVSIQATGTRVEQVNASGSEAAFFAAAALFGGGIASYYLENYVWAGGSITGVTMTAQLGTQTEILTIETHSATPRLWSCVISSYDSEAVYVLATEKREQSSPSITQATFSGDTIGVNSVFGGSIVFAFNGGVTMTGEAYTRIMDPGTNTTTGWWGAIANTINRGDEVEISPAIETVTPPSYVVHSPHGVITLPSDGYWPTLFPESVLEGLSVEGQPVKTALSYNGDGMVYSEEGSEKKIGGYLINPGPASFFIGGA